MLKSSRVMGGSDGCEGVTSGIVNGKESMIASVDDGPLSGQPYACGSEYPSEGNSRALMTTASHSM